MENNYQVRYYQNEQGLIIKMNVSPNTYIPASYKLVAMDGIGVNAETIKEQPPNDHQ